MKYEVIFFGNLIFICYLTLKWLDVIVYLEEVTPVPELDPVLWGAELPVVFVVELDELAFNTWYSSCRFAFSVSNSLKTYDICLSEWRLVTKTQYMLRYRLITLSLLQADNAFHRLILPSIVMGCREQESLYLRCVASGNIVQSASVHR